MAKIRQALDDEFHPDFRLLDERGPTPRRAQQAGEYVFRDDKGRQHLRDSPLNVALARKQINEQQYTAGTKFYNHWFRGGLSPGFGSVDLHGIFGGTAFQAAGMAKTEAQFFHRERYRQAVKVLGIHHWAVERMICAEETFEQIGRQLGWHNRPQAVAVAVDRIRSGLDNLCREWGIFETGGRIR